MCYFVQEVVGKVNSCIKSRTALCGVVSADALVPRGSSHTSIDGLDHSLCCADSQLETERGDGKRCCIVTDIHHNLLYVSYNNEVVLNLQFSVKQDTGHLVYHQV